MNILYDSFPGHIMCNGKKYEVNTDFKVWLKFYSILSDKTLRSREKIMQSVLCCFDAEKCRHLPPDSTEMMNALIEFFGGDTKNKESNSEKKIFDFTEDAEYIFSAFYQEYGIDLTSCEMHWYKFLALLRGLTDRCELIKIIEYRSINLSDIDDEAKRKFYRKMKNLYALKNDVALSENEIAQKLASVF